MLVLVGGIAAALLTLAPGRGGAAQQAPSHHAAAASWRGLVGGARAPAAVGQRVVVVLSAFSLADRVTRAGGLADDREMRRWTAAAFAAQQQLIADLGRRGVRVKPEHRFTRTLNGFSALLDPRAIAVLERTKGVRGVYPVRAAYPGAVSTRVLRSAAFAPGLGHRPDLSLAGATGRGVTIALLDTGVDLRKPYLHGHVLDGIDVVGDGPTAQARAKPGDPAQIESHGTEMAGILVGAGGPGGLHGVAPGATVLPIRVAGWQPDLAGGFFVYARTDQVVAGLERAVDPNGDGDVHDAARVALVPLVEPFAAFADSPLSRAADGALRLDTLVVAAAGNDGPAGPSFGSVGGAGGSPAALTVGAADARRASERVRLVARTGLRVLLDRVVPLVGAVAPERTLELAPASARGTGAELEDFFDPSGLSAVAGRAAVVRAAADPAAAVRNAARAGAAAVLLYGRDVAAGGLGLEEGVGVPVVSIPEAAARALLTGPDAVVAIGAPRVEPAGTGPSVAAFSSWGLAFDGGVKPELVAPGVGIVTAMPGTNADGSSAFGTVNGSSAAAAVVAGALALLAQARPDLRASTLGALLIGSGRQLPGAPLPAQGTGLVDLGRAAAAEVAARPATIVFGRGRGDGWQETKTLLLRNVSTRRLTLFVATGQQPGSSVLLAVSPRRLELQPGEAIRVRVRARLVSFVRGPATSGALVVTPVGGVGLRVPWSVVLAPGGPGLLGPLALSTAAFKPSERSPAVLTLRAGRVLRSPRGGAIEPVLRLDVELWTKSGKRLGLLARLRDLLPGRYAFGITGRGPNGRVLERGSYRLRLFAWPTAGGPPSSRSIAFRIR